MIAEHPATGDQIVLFDGDRHGYNGMFVDWREVTGDRTPVSIYRDKDGEELFSVIIWCISLIIVKTQNWTSTTTDWRHCGTGQGSMLRLPVGIVTTFCKS